MDWCCRPTSKVVFALYQLLHTKCSTKCLADKSFILSCCLGPLITYCTPSRTASSVFQSPLLCPTSSNTNPISWPWPPLRPGKSQRLPLCEADSVSVFNEQEGQIYASCHQNLFRLVWLDVDGVEPSLDIAFTREVGCPSLQKKKTVCPQFRSGHKDEQINRRKLTSSLVQLEFDSKRNMHCSVVLTSIL